LDDVAQTLGLQEADFAPTVWQAGIYNESRYGIPLDVHPLGFYYNKTVMEQAGLDPEKPPTNDEEYQQALEEMKAKGIQGYWMSPFVFTGALVFQSLLWQFGGELYNADATQATFNSEAGVNALTWMADMVRNGYSPKNVGQDADSIAFQNDKNAFIWTGIWMINAYKEIPQLEWGLAELPQIGDERAAWAGSHNLVIMNQRGQDPNKLQASKVFINWLTEHSLEWAKGGQVPALADVRESGDFQALEHQSVLAKQIDYVHFPPPVPGIGDPQATLATAVNEAVLLKKEPQAALDEAAQQADELLQENAEKYGS
jgi:multiple sugar transport system substrate-binding protein